MPLCLDEIQKEIDEAVADSGRTWEFPKGSSEKPESDKENESKPQPQLQDSFDLNFAALSLNTPAKPSEVVKPAKFVTPSEYKSTNFLRTSRSLNFQHATPNNKVPTKVQCSVNMQPYLKTPITKVLTAQKSKQNDSGSETVQLSVPRGIDFHKMKVNNVTYVILNELGKGGSSEVFQCFNMQTKALRAIKVVSLENRTSAIGFINEVQTLKRLQKCNRIIKMYDL